MPTPPTNLQDVLPVADWLLNSCVCLPGGGVLSTELPWWRTKALGRNKGNQVRPSAGSASRSLHCGICTAGDPGLPPGAFPVPEASPPSPTAHCCLPGTQAGHCQILPTSHRSSLHGHCATDPQLPLRKCILPSPSLPWGIQLVSCPDPSQPALL